MPYRDHLKHISVTNRADQHNYTSPNQAPRARFPTRNRSEHSEHLVSQFSSIRIETDNIRAARSAGDQAPDGIYLEFESHIGFDLTTKSLDLPSLEITVLSVKETKVGNDIRVMANVFIPDESIPKFIKKIEEYRDLETKSGNPKNRALVDSIDDEVGS